MRVQHLPFTKVPHAVTFLISNVHQLAMSLVEREIVRYRKDNACYACVTFVNTGASGSSDVVL